MDKSTIKGMAVGGIAMAVLGSGAVTGYKAMTKPTFADVVAASAVETYRTTLRRPATNPSAPRPASIST